MLKTNRLTKVRKAHFYISMNNQSVKGKEKQKLLYDFALLYVQRIFSIINSEKVLNYCISLGRIDKIENFVKAHVAVLRFHFSSILNLLYILLIDIPKFTDCLNLVTIQADECRREA